MPYRLVRKEDGLTKTSEKVCYISWYVKTSKFKKKHRIPKVGMSLLMSPFNICFTWQTSAITDVIEYRKDYAHFKTKNSEYELFKEETLIT